MHRAGDFGNVVPGFTVTASTVGGRVLLTVEGELDMATAPRLRDAFAESHEEDVDLECSAMTFVDSTGLSVLLAASRRWQDNGRTLRLLNPSRPLRRLLEITGVEHVFEIVEPTAD